MADAKSLLHLDLRTVFFAECGRQPGDSYHVPLDTCSLAGPDHYFLQGAIAYNISARKKEGLVRFTGPTRY